MSMPSRAVTSFLQRHKFPAKGSTHQGVNALSGCYLISTVEKYAVNITSGMSVNALSGCYLISTSSVVKIYEKAEHHRVNALSGCYLISTCKKVERRCLSSLYVSMPSRAVTSFLPEPEPEPEDDESECQCPLGLLPHFYSTLSKT